MLRLFTKDPIILEKVPKLETKVTHGSWIKVSENDSTGGPLKIKKDTTLKPNAKWCQNPQYHVEPINLFSKQDLYVKIVLHRTDRDPTTLKNNSVKNGKSIKISSTSADAKNEAMVGLVICKADCLEEGKMDLAKLKHQPRENFLGEVRYKYSLYSMLNVIYLLQSSI
jgi:hypothetical protein